jgi:RND family efflux transporter MFP subunit
MRKKTTTLALVGMMIAGLSLFASGCSHDTPAEAMELPTAEVSVAMLSAGTEGGYFETVGRVKNVRESILASKVMGSVTALKVKSGDHVKRGQLLLSIDAKDVAGQVQQAGGALAQANAALSISKSNFERFEELKASGSASQAEYDKALFDYQTAQGAVKQAKGAMATAGSYLSEARVTAPFDGIVVDTMIEQGEMVAPGRPLVRMEGATQGKSDLEFETTVTERDVDHLKVGTSIDVALDTLGDKLVDGTISEIVPSSDGTHSNTVRVKLEGVDGIRTGMFGRARFALPEGAAAVMTVPADRIVRHGQLSAIYVVDATDTIRLRLIREGRTLGDRVEVLGGPSATDRLVISEIARLIDSQGAKVVQ